ncbi:hypothetical protein QU617_15295 [Pseudomonas guariconensis]|jgi:hypothetical protein|uniref:hypothetical protein n=1 Tax=Pseudomonas guariconensis TaxID=1288410 RepID=UPI0025AAE0B5|nr:hypothetical protein [Pseudomonas guariconensis]MDM9612464.1 hypothetical protein [Pseudomonas guariconensis]
MSAVHTAIESAGGPIAAAAACGVSRQSVDKWISKARLPRTEYTGETSYAEALAKAAKENGKPFDIAWLLANASPRKSAA